MVMTVMYGDLAIVPLFGALPEAETIALDLAVCTMTTGILDLPLMMTEQTATPSAASATNYHSLSNTLVRKLVVTK